MYDAIASAKLTRVSELLMLLVSAYPLPVLYMRMR